MQQNDSLVIGYASRWAEHGERDVAVQLLKERGERVRPQVDAVAAAAVEA